ncbi:hypothetical protein EBU71_20585, partial [bacterium]|nr:hypothetical protein [Candidatus Elulimicrobium humile]
MPRQHKYIVAIVNISDLYGVFQTGDYPSQQDFKNLIDSCYNYFPSATGFPANSEIILPGNLIVSGSLSAVNTSTTLYKILSADRDLAQIFFLKISGDSVYTSVNLTSGSWDSVYSTTQANSAGWESVETSVNNTSANWDSVYTTTRNNSAGWESVEA